MHDNDKIELTADEQAALAPALTRIHLLQAEINTIIASIDPFVTMMAKSHGVAAQDYALTPDGKLLVKKTA